MKPGTRILIVEDDALLRQLLARALTIAGYEVAEADDGQEALVQFELNPAELVLTDIVMPNQEGLETIGKLLRKNPVPKIVAMSGGGIMDPGGYLAMASKLGAAATLQKPFSHEQMLETLAQVLAPRRNTPVAAG